MTEMQTASRFILLMKPNLNLCHFSCRLQWHG